MGAVAGERLRAPASSAVQTPVMPPPSARASCCLPPPEHTRKHPDSPPWVALPGRGPGLYASGWRVDASAMEQFPRPLPHPAGAFCNGDRPSGPRHHLLAWLHASGAFCAHIPGRDQAAAGSVSGWCSQHVNSRSAAFHQQRGPGTAQALFSHRANPFTRHRSARADFLLRWLPADRIGTSSESKFARGPRMTAAPSATAKHSEARACCFRVLQTPIVSLQDWTHALPRGRCTRVRPVSDFLVSAEYTRALTVCCNSASQHAFPALSAGGELFLHSDVAGCRSSDGWAPQRAAAPSIGPELTPALANGTNRCRWPAAGAVLAKANRIYGALPSDHNDSVATLARLEAVAEAPIIAP